MAVGVTRVVVAVAHPSQERRPEQVELLLDTGALLTVVPRAILQSLGVRPTERRRFRGFAGEVERDTGGIWMEYEGQSSIVPVVFGEDGDPALMGITALEALGYEVDPVAGKLRRTDLLLLLLTQNTPLGPTERL